MIAIDVLGYPLEAAQAVPQPASQPQLTGKVHVLFILDKSGSMLSLAREVRQSFNAYVASLRADSTDYSLSAILFDTQVTKLFTQVPLAEEPLLDEQNYRPSGGTALYDAVGTMLKEADRAWATKDKPYGEERMLCIIQTDGEENSSTHSTREDIVAAIKVRTDAGNWTFVYLGADQDAWAGASSLGIPKGNTFSYDSADTEDTFRSLGLATSAYSGSSVSSSADFFNPSPNMNSGSGGPPLIEFYEGPKKGQD